MNYELCQKSRIEVENILSENNPILGEMFNSISHSLLDLYCNEKSIEKVINEIDVHEIFRNINPDTLLIPSKGNFNCLPRLIAFANGNWDNKSKNGFPKIFKNIVHCWADCKKIENTLIITSAWDTKSFIEDYMDVCRVYSEDEKSIAIVMISLTGFSVQFLN